MLFPPAGLEHVSSSLVRELYTFGHPTESLLPEGITLEEYLR
jgi:phosphopantetheine adenylyltransferase